MPPWDNTFSITARCTRTGALGVAVCTARPAVGNRVPFVLAGVGAAASQANTNPQLGRRALQWLMQGATPKEALHAALDEDTERETRQLAVMDASGASAVFTGQQTQKDNPWAGSLAGPDCVTAGNLLVSAATLGAMVSSFAASEGFLGDRLLAALTAGQAAGGDKRGKVSAALKVSLHPGESLHQPPWPLDVRVDASENPVEDLCRVYARYVEAFRS